MKRNPRSGYALLFVYMMAATMAIMLYMAMPRVAFESQRDREQLLIDRGEQYKRAVQLYVRKFNRFPVDIQALENTQNIRFLRKQYIDPMTGKSDWRLIHVGPGGVFTDSLVHGAAKKDQGSGPQSFITEMQQIGGNQSGQVQGVNQATRRRASDDPGVPGALPADPNNTGTGSQNTIPTSGPVMVLPDGRIVPATSTGVPAPAAGTSAGGTAAATAGGQFPAQIPGQLPNPTGQGQYPGLPGQPLQPGQIPLGGFQSTPNGPSGNAASLINQILTTPRPGGLNGNNGGFTPGDGSTGGAMMGGLNGTPNNTGTPAGGMGGTTIGGGIAGVASKLEQEGIKIYNERTSYNEWEFVYDMSKDATKVGAAAAGINTGQQQQAGQTSQSMTSKP